MLDDIGAIAPSPTPAPEHVEVGVLKLPPPLARWSAFVLAASQKHGVPESLIYAHMSRETGGHNIRGDGGHGRGLMQIDDRSWGEWLAAHDEGMDPESNIDKGAEIIRSNVDWWDRHQDLLPQLADPAFRLRCAIASYNCGAGNVLRALKAKLDIDHFTAPPKPGEPGNYSADVLRRQAGFLGQETSP